MRVDADNWLTLKFTVDIVDLRKNMSMGHSYTHSTSQSNLVIYPKIFESGQMELLSTNV